MSDVSLRDQAVAELKLTTVGYKNSKWTVPPAGTHWANALALLAQIGNTPPPPSGVVVYYNNSGASAWPAIQAVGGNTLICGADDIPSMDALKASGGKAWATLGYWNDSAGAFSRTDQDVLAAAKQAVASYPGVITGWYVADEPSMSHSNAPALVAARGALLQSVLNVPTIIAMWDTSIFSNFKATCTAFAIDGYPNRDNWNMNDITSRATAADNMGIHYYGVLGAFTDGGVYQLPNPSQLTEMANTWKATKQLGQAVYLWGPGGGPTSGELQNHPELLAVLKAEYA